MEQNSLFVVWAGGRPLSRLLRSLLGPGERHAATPTFTLSRDLMTERKQGKQKHLVPVYVQLPIVRLFLNPLFKQNHILKKFDNQCLHKLGRIYELYSSVQFKIVIF